MDTDDYYTATPEERTAMVASIKPPNAHTHRGAPRSFEMDGYHEATKPKRGLSHRANIPARVPENIPPFLLMIQAHADQAERNRNA